MNTLPLLDAPEDSAGNRSDKRSLRVAVSSERGKWVVVRQGLLDSRLLTSVHTTTAWTDLWDTKRGPGRLTRENPFLSPAQRALLDERGLIREGATVEERGILASIVLAANEHPLGFQPVHGMRWTQDQSYRVPVGWGGAVAARVRLLSRQDIYPKPPKNLRERVEFELRAERDLETGDALLVSDLPLAVYAVRADEEMPRDDAGNVVDVLIAADAAAQIGMKPGSHCSLPVSKGDFRADDALQARATGPYSLITLQPLRGGPEPSQEVTAAQIQWLRAHGMEAILAELVCLKSDDLAAREQALGREEMASSGSRSPGEEGAARLSPWRSFPAGSNALDCASICNRRTAACP